LAFAPRTPTVLRAQLKRRVVRLLGHVTTVNKTAITPLRFPRDLQDALFIIVFGLVALIVAGGPWLAVILLSLPVAWCALWLALVFGLHVVDLLNTVRRLELSPSGIRFVRPLGQPKFLSWEQITRIRPASRREVIIQGWLWPPFPLLPRAATRAMTSLGHYRIEWDAGFCFFPPSEEQTFVDTIRCYLSDRPSAQPEFPWEAKLREYTHPAA